MAKVFVLYCSAYGHIERMAQAIAEGARSAAGTEVTVKRVPELVPEDLARKAGMSSTRRRRSPASMNYPATTRSSSAHRRDSAT